MSDLENSKLAEKRLFEAVEWFKSESPNRISAIPSIIENARIILKGPISEEIINKDWAMKVVGGWKSFWMNQHQNSVEDQQNYFGRALGVDANMSHNLAMRIRNACLLVRDVQREQLKAEIEDLKSHQNPHAGSCFYEQCWKDAKEENVGYMAEISTLKRKLEFVVSMMKRDAEEFDKMGFVAFKEAIEKRLAELDAIGEDKGE